MHTRYVNEIYILWIKLPVVIFQRSTADVIGTTIKVITFWSSVKMFTLLWEEKKVVLCGYIAGTKWPNA